MKNVKGIVVEGSTFSGFDTAISAENSDFLMSKTNVINNRTGLSLNDSLNQGAKYVNQYAVILKTIIDFINKLGG
jgi:hypothetical protein